MRRPVIAAAPAALLVASALIASGCQKAAGPPQPPATPESPASAATSPAAIVPPATDVAALPAGVLRAYVWECDDGLTLVMKNLIEDQAIGLDLHSGTRKLPQVVAASGAKYSDGDFTFWTKGDTATFQRKDNPAVSCRELRARSLVEDARARGVVYRGIGNEPGWTVEVGPGDRLQFVTNFGESAFEFSGATAVEADGAQVYTAQNDADTIRVAVKKEPCQDDMAGTAFDHSMVTEHGGRVLRGCAVALQ